MSLQTYNTQVVETFRAYFVGTTVLRKGQVLCYQENAAVPGAVADDDNKLQLGQAVEVINSDNVAHCAGIVDDSCVGKTGPCFVEIVKLTPGLVIQVEMDGTTDISIGDSLELDATLGAFIKDATVAAGLTPSLIAKEAYTTDATKAAKWAFVKIGA